MQQLVAKVSTTINAPIAKVWEALTSPEIIKQYMFGTTVVSDWQVGSSITWRGEWEGKPYEDTGTITQIEENRILEYDYYSPLTGPDVPENHHHITVELESQGDAVIVSFSQDNNATEEARTHSEKNWQMVLDGLKQLLEQ